MSSYHADDTLRLIDKGLASKFYISKDQIDSAIAEAPAMALSSKAVRDLMSDAQLNAAIDAAPADALTYVLDQLTNEQFNTAVAAAPGTALLCALDRLSTEQFNTAVAVAPGSALLCAMDRLSSEQFNAAFAAVVDAAGPPLQSILRTQAVLDRANDEQFHTAITAEPDAALRSKVAQARMTDEQRLTVQQLSSAHRVKVAVRTAALGIPDMDFARAAAAEPELMKAVDPERYEALDELRKVVDPEAYEAQERGQRNVSVGRPGRFERLSSLFFGQSSR